MPKAFAYFGANRKGTAQKRQKRQRYTESTRQKWERCKLASWEVAPPYSTKYKKTILFITNLKICSYERKQQPG